MAAVSNAVLEPNAATGATPAWDPRREYEERLAARQATETRTRRQFQHIGHVRVVVFVGIVLLVWLAEKEPWLPALVLPPALAFIGLVLWHARVTAARQRAARAAAYYARRLDCLNDRWAGKGEPGTRYLEESHPYTLDLDIFGPGSLFELLSTARLRSGEDKLADWLRGPATRPVIEERQAALRDLRCRLELREQVALLGEDVPASVDLAGLIAWGQEPPIPTGRGLRLALLLLSMTTVILIALFLDGRLNAWPPLIALGVQIGFTLWLYPRVRQVVAGVEKRAQDLALFAGILARIERDRLTAPALAALQQRLTRGGLPPSRRIGQLANLVDWLNARRNMYSAPLAALLMWTTQMAFAIEAWRRAHGPGIADWLDVVGEFEALASLAAYSYEQPTDPFPELRSEGPWLEAEAVGHPLLPRARCVTNDVQLGGDVQVLVVSGSNMSGKSTLLRSLGINVVLALAGAPVRGRRLCLSPLAVGATLRIQDSLQAGRSRFYAEITRLRQLMDMAKGPVPLLFLLDEILHGTNSHDRRLGAEAVVRGLVAQRAIGLVTTHDLALTHIAELLPGRAINVHFEDRMENGEMIFDYRMRPGVVQNSNALALMRAVGIEV